jgi:hypothetical protein
MDRLHRRAEKAWTVATIHHTALREAYKWYMPKRWKAQDAQNNEANQTRNSYDHLFDSTGMQALADGASQIAEAIHPWDQVWGRWVPRTDIDEGIRDEVEAYAEQQTNITTALINRSNFDGSAVAAHKEFLLGTGFLAVDIDPLDDKRLRFTALPAYQMAVESDASGRITGIFRKVKTKARDLDVSIVNGDWSENARKQQKDDPDSELEYWMGVYSEGPDWQVCYWELATKHKVAEQTENTPPIICYRAHIEAGNAWGDGPGMQALPDVKVANKIVQFVMENAAFAITGVFQVEDDGVINPNNVQIRPGALFVIAQGSKGIQPIESPGDFNVSELVLNDLRTSIRRAFYVVRIEEREMSATEYSGRVQQQLREQRGVYGQLKGEFAEPLMRRVLDLAVRMGLIPRTNFERNLAEVELTGPLASDVRGVAVERFKAVVQDLQGIFGPEIAIGAIRSEKAVPWLAQQRHAKLELFLDEAGLMQFGNQIREMVAQIQAQQQLEQSGGQVPVEAGVAA